MSTRFSPQRFAAAVCIGGLLAGCTTAPTRQESTAQPAAPQATQPAPPPGPPATKPGLDRSGSKQVGKASFYADKFSGRKMADGSRMDPRDDNAASKTLPLGTVARVTNLHNGRSAVVTIRDRGPHARGRILDVSPRVARELGMTQHGTAPVEVVVMRAPPGR